MTTFVTYLALETSACGADVQHALARLGAVGTAVREDGDVPEVLYLESVTLAGDARRAQQEGRALGAALVSTLRCPAVVAEIVVIDPDGATQWLAESVLR